MSAPGLEALQQLLHGLGRLQRNLPGSGVPALPTGGPGARQEPAWDASKSSSSVRSVGDRSTFPRLVYGPKGRKGTRRAEGLRDLRACSKLPQRAAAFGSLPERGLGKLCPRSKATAWRTRLRVQPTPPVAARPKFDLDLSWHQNSPLPHPPPWRNTSSAPLTSKKGLSPFSASSWALVRQAPREGPKWQAWTDGVGGFHRTDRPKHRH